MNTIILTDTNMLLESAEFLSMLIRDINEQRGMVEEEIADLERVHNDIIHKLEKPTCKYRERAKLATQLASVRRERRKLKDWLIENRPYFDYFGCDDGKKIQNMLGNLIGRGRKVKREDVT